MSQLSIRLPETPLTVTPEEFAAIAAANPDLQLERGVNGELIVNPPTGGESSRRNLKIGRYLDEWTDCYLVVTARSRLLQFS
ncbi:MAG: Uma2 family endonuclease [Halothece sp.]